MPNPTQPKPPASTQEDVLLSMLPMGMQDVGILDLFYLQDTRADTIAAKKRSLSVLKKMGCIERREVEVSSSFRSYKLRYAALTPEGIGYLINKHSRVYGQRYIWLKVDLVNEPPEKLQTSNAISPAQLERLLQMQAARAFFYNVAQQPAIHIDTAREHPDTEMSVLAQGFCGFLGDAVAGTLVETMASKRPAAVRGIPELCKGELRYLDTVTGLADHRASWMTGFPVGVIAGSPAGLIPVYVTAKHGLGGGAGNGNRIWGQLSEMITPMINQRAVPCQRAQKCIILCKCPEEWERTITDGHKQRMGGAPLSRYYGDEAYLLPFPQTLAEKAQVGQLLQCVVSAETEQLSMETLASAEGVTWSADRKSLLYQGRTLVNGTTFRAGAIALCRSDPDRYRQIGCWTWQAGYLRAVLPETVRIYTLEKHEGRGTLLKVYDGGGINDKHHRGVLAEV